MGNQRTNTQREKLPLEKLDHSIVMLTNILGNVSLLAMAAFAFSGSLNLVDLGLGEFGSLSLDALLSSAFFIQHSVMIRKSFRNWSSQFIEQKYHGALFTIASSILLLLLVVLWQKSNHTVYAVESIIRWGFRGLFALAVIGFYWGVRSLGMFDAYGLLPILKGAQYSTATSRLMVRGPYRWVRHPLYLFCILMIWSCPDLTVDRLLFNLLWTAWIVVGTILEERDLVAQFGENYRAYQTEVPMLLPSTIRPVR